MTKRVRKNGLYKRYFDNGKQLSEENYNDGKLEGKWTYWYENGQLKLKGNFKPYEVLPEDERWERSSPYRFPARDSKHGKWTEWYENGQKKREQNYECGRVIGKWTSWYENGNKKSEGFYKGLHGRYGEWKFWHSNGQLACTGIYEDDAEDVAGLWIFWDEKGKKVYENKFNEIELSVDLMIIGELGKLRVAGCSKGLVEKFGEYIF